MSDHLLEAVISSIGVHPASIEQNGVSTPRDRYGDGWNAALIEGYRRHQTLVDWSTSLTEQEDWGMRVLLEADLLDLGLDEGNVVLSINMNDVFVPAVVSESIEQKDLEPLARLFNEYGHSGVAAWMSERYTCAPRSGHVDEQKYVAALKDLGRDKS